ncbi:MAG: DHHA1 domain-containing protein [Candidatus Bathyarchaeia archaeon]
MARWIFTHGDGDGLCAGALSSAANPDAMVYFSNPFGLLEDLENVDEGDSVIICDIALSEDKLQAVVEKFSMLDEGGGLIYIDHHPLPEGLRVKDIPGKVVYRLNSSASELTYRFFREKLGGLLGVLAVYGAVADYLDDTPLIRKLLRMWDRRTVYFETGVLVQGIEGRKRDYEFKRSLVHHLAMGSSPASYPKLVELAVENTLAEWDMIRELKDYLQVEGEIAYVLDMPFSHGKSAVYVRALADVKVGVAGETRKGMVDMSLRTCSRDLDLNRILRRIAPMFGGSGGGHPAAAGARIPEQSFNEFIQRLNGEICMCKGKASGSSV